MNTLTDNRASSQQRAGSFSLVEITIGAGSELHLGAGGASFLARAHGIYFTPAHLLALIDPPKFDPLSLIVNPPRP